MVQNNRVIVYIDGFNLYFAMKALDWQKYYWLSLYCLSNKLLKKDQHLVSVKYFTSRLSSKNTKQPKAKRQNTYLEALGEAGNVQIIYGTYEAKEWKCPRCTKISYVTNEKRTDVNIATEIIMDAFFDKYDTAILISTDSDLVAPVKSVKEGFSQKNIICAFPPKRFSLELANAASGYNFINKSQLSQCQLPNKIRKGNGFVLEKPEHWN